MPKIEIYTRPGCGYCHAAKALLQRKGVQYEETDVWANPDKRPEMLARSGGAATFPQVFIDNHHVGGCDDLHALDRAGRLDSLLAA